MGRAQAVPAWHACAESGGGAGGKRDGAQVSGGGCVEGARAPTCAQTRMNGAAGTDVRTRTSVRTSGR
jgi:hypothetical protein